MAHKKSRAAVVAHAAPSKSFFVRMLVRDIALEDAILDLLDNCIDGVLRTIPKEHRSKPKAFNGYWASITLSPERFEIKDNCGGIPKKIARDKAFRLGRLPGDESDIPTVGMYGIGMKRAIFKMAEAAYVISLHEHSNFRVDISNEWLNDNDDWDLPLRPMKKGALLAKGTAVVVTKLKDEIAKAFGENSNFVDDFKQFVAAHYALIIGKGFRVKINGQLIEAESFGLLVAGDAEALVAGNKLGPYCFRATVDDVHIELLAGLYRRLPNEDELDAEASSRGTRDDAGWTVSCNDRVVVHRDKTRLTGWGDGGVPNYHGQFIAITGLVMLTSAKPERLPLTTTKRGLEASSNVYLILREQMQLATRFLTSFTNKWKKRTDELEEIYKNAELANVSDIRALLRSVAFSPVRKVEGGQRFEPSLPQPDQIDKGVRISFLRPRPKVDKLRRALYGSADCSPADLGELCFDRVYSEVVK